MWCSNQSRYKDEKNLEQGDHNPICLTMYSAGLRMIHSEFVVNKDEYHVNYLPMGEKTFGKWQAGIQAEICTTLVSHVWEYF